MVLSVGRNGQFWGDVFFSGGLEVPLGVVADMMSGEGC